MGKRQREKQAKARAQNMLLKPREKRTASKKPGSSSGQVVEINEALWRPARISATADVFKDCNKMGLASFEVFNPNGEPEDVEMDLEQYTFMDGEEFEVSEGEDEAQDNK
ncbi:hypothetical protein J8273_6476 [Carpediemonas membranifera]|uniref:Uncharacterized protein n=1 Tax=Carpediemonas membranifera TaxID=201153 RepID=A0A8J6AT35_9EUKA|nr:hypothetical protein J8273_6476 [Carpediemonas membranifera]|eukprot:KAG9391700.1 hypothetical protein J8273_6476 [Carpediemonas membranifera]